jgi:hypothetical protein
MLGVLGAPGEPGAPGDPGVPGDDGVGGGTWAVGGLGVDAGDAGLDNRSFMVRKRPSPALDALSASLIGVPHHSADAP